ncbi:MAG: DUF2029 domain-containing protein [Deltaproteobacteria bacterium]|nr:DUF2029 domain-containing protein [Deltaproteobacteria bacterium]
MSGRSRSRPTRGRDWLPGRRDVGIASLLGLLVLLAHGLSPIRTSFDSRWTIPTAVSIAYRGDDDLDEYAWPIVEVEGYAVEWRRGRSFSRYPVGPSLLAVPGVLLYDVVARVAGAASVEELVLQGRAAHVEAGVASLVVAVVTVLIFLMARCRELGRGSAAMVALVFAFCTPAWSTASRGLWQHGPSMLTLAAAMALLLLARRHDAWVVAAGLALGLGFLMRPTNAIPLAVLTAYVALRHPWRLPAMAVASGAVVAAFVAWNLQDSGVPLPAYYQAGTQPWPPLSEVPRNLAGHFVSPNRGLLVFSPVVLLAAAGIAMQVRRRTLDALDVALLAVLCGHFALVASFRVWWAGHSFGPRFATDILPVLAWFAMPVVRAIGDLPSHRRRAARAFTALLIAWSFLVHLRAATTWDVWAWNGSPVSIDDRPQRAWDWSDLQILRGLGRDDRR